MGGRGWWCVALAVSSALSHRLPSLSSPSYLTSLTSPPLPPRHSTHRPPHEQLLVRLEVCGASFGLLSSFRPHPLIHLISPPLSSPPPCRRPHPLPSLLLPISTPRAVARGGGSGCCTGCGGWWWWWWSLPLSSPSSCVPLPVVSSCPCRRFVPPPSSSPLPSCLPVVIPPINHPTSSCS